MTLSVSSLASFLRVSMLALLMMGVVIKPMLAPFCEIHALGHLLRTYSHEPGRSGLESAEHQLDQHNVRGAHGLLHEGDSGSAYADNAASIEVAAFTYDRIRVAPPPASAVPLQRTSAPFRPPLA
ncbi:MAG: hypothetical protein SGI99_08305 [Pseudomonadota bacterium]|nr:hypothetical protein [Pseudomonadota bacterium]